LHNEKLVVRPRFPAISRVYRDMPESHPKRVSPGQAAVRGGGAALCEREQHGRKLERKEEEAL